MNGSTAYIRKEDIESAWNSMERIMLQNSTKICMVILIGNIGRRTFHKTFHSKNIWVELFCLRALPLYFSASYLFKKGLTDDKVMALREKSKRKRELEDGSWEDTKIELSYRSSEPGQMETTRTLVGQEWRRQHKSN